MSVARQFRDFIRDRVGIEIRRVHNGPPAAPSPQSLSKLTQYWEVEQPFLGRTEDAYERTAEGPIDNTPGSRAQRGKLFNLDGLLHVAPREAGLVAEVGCFHGLSAFILAQRLRDEDPSFAGDGFHLFDSFEGISALTASDRPDDPNIPVGGKPREAGMFAATVETVRSVLADFPAVSFHKGWIPDCFADAPEGPYRFVHIDVDVYQPMLDSLEFFYPRMGPGGIIVCDDYGPIRWPGVRTAVDEFASRCPVSVLPLSAGQAVLLSR